MDANRITAGQLFHDNARTLTHVFLREDVNFLLTNRIPRRLLTRFMGWFSKIEQPLVRDASIALWQLFSDLDLSEARKSKFKSVHDCFTRELKEGARPIDGDPGIVVSPCDAIVGAHGRIAGTELLQIKGFPLQPVRPARARRTWSSATATASTSRCA